MYPPNFKTQLITALLDWLWRSWISLGVSGHGSAARGDRVIDPEALILAGSLWARYDPRLFDEMLDWLCLHGNLIHLQRLRNLHRTGLGDPQVLSAIAAVVVERSPHSKWKTLLSKPASIEPLTPLFLSLEEKTITWGEPDPLFASRGFHRGRLELRQLSQAPNPRRAANLWLKLRGLFGLSARAEIMLQLLTAGPATAGEIARRSSFTARSVLLPLREMAMSGHLHEPPRPIRPRATRGPATPRTRGPSIAYALRPEDWSFLRTWEEPSGFPALILPAPLLLLCQRVLAHFDAADSTASPALQSIQLRESIAAPLAEIQRLGLAGEYGLPPDLPGDRLVGTLSERLPAVIAKL